MRIILVYLQCSLGLGGVAAVVLIVLAVAVPLTSQSGQATDPEGIARAILRRVPLIDGYVHKKLYGWMGDWISWW